MRKDIDPTIERLVRLTHNPRGRYADTSRLYEELLQRIDPPRASELPDVAAAHPQRHRGILHTALPRWWRAAAAELLLVGVAIAGVGVYQWSPTSPTESDTQQPGHVTARILTYSEAPLSLITDELSAIYGTTILVTDTPLRDFRITATFSTDEPLDEILHALADVAGCSVRHTEAAILLEAE